MSQPRRIVRGSTYLITRRCLQRCFLLRPDPMVNRIIEFCIAYAAERTGVEVHAYCAESNHLHLVVTDPQGRVSEFAQWLHRHVALCLNSYFERQGVVWEPGRFRPVLLAQPEDTLSKIVYTLLNPVKDGLVPCGDEWPGVRSRVEELGRLERVIERPPVYFTSRTGGVPERATLRLTVPPGFSGVEELQREVGEKLAVEERHCRETIEGDFVGAERVKSRPIDSRPSTPERRGQRNPWIACQDKQLRIRLIEKLRDFWRDYREAYRRYQRKEHDVPFPFGTYWMRVQFGVNCEPAPP